jgi:hypothetical protein
MFRAKKKCLDEKSLWLQRCSVISRTGKEAWVARWFVFEPKIQIWVNFGGCCDVRCWYYLWPFSQCYGHLVYFMPICNILRILVYFKVIWYILPVLVICRKNNLATLKEA